MSSRLRPRWPANTRAHATSTRLPVDLTSPPHHSDLPELVPSHAQRSTIYALSTPPGKGGVAVVRISGPDALTVWQRMALVRASKGKEVGPQPWKMERCKIVHPVSGEALDDGLTVYFRGPKSFTTEDVLELHLHSGRAIVSAVLNALACIPSLRLAEPGEFTRRAFEGGRLDLTQVEGLRDLIDAETEVQRRAALRVAEGSARVHLDKLRQEIIECSALVEALIDFGEGEDLEDGVYNRAREHVQRVRKHIHKILSDNRRGEILRSGIRLAIFGPPNAGKSSLLNFFARRDAAIVTPIPGTTRDILELSLDIGGLPVIVADTAGLRQTDDLVESIGVERAQKAVEAADVNILVLSLPDIITKTTSGPSITIPPFVSPLLTKDTLVLLNKVDLMTASDLEIATQALLDFSDSGHWLVSLTKDEGTDVFVADFSAALRARYNLLQEEDVNESPLITHARHRTHLETALQFLDAFLQTPFEQRITDDVVLGAEELRYAAQAVGQISGLIENEDVLDVIFRDFCIGK
ncbi:tRNA modification GTPase TrmE [Auriscalpium vulgare]|uniref:tRNA modification GTPase TrmE n=1 Tax=Auriscalpium vulgare TaxID=40419 RepID=A0ACB8RTU2_9AGAM|nr:tRNA modification GTPase TrmE [Auriscalpium vulgare]